MNESQPDIPSPADENGNTDELAARNPDGTFGQGNRFGAGNPNHKRVAQLRQTFISEGLRKVDGESEDDARIRMAKVAEKMYQLAEGGDVQAARLVMEYSIGKPATSITIEGEDGPRYRLIANVSEDAI